MSIPRNSVLIAGITPYFLERENFWIEQNKNKILESRKTQSFFEDNTILLGKDQNYNLSELLRKLDEMGYEKVLQISEPGEFSQRGGIVDVFPINLNRAIRFEFFGNKIENIEQLLIKIDDEKSAKEKLKKKLKSQKLFSDLRGLKPGDYLVHLDHGIGRFVGISYPVSGSSYSEEIIRDTKYKIPDTKYYILEYAAGDKLYVPLGLERKLSRYIGFIEPKISRLGSALWQRTKKKIKEDAEKLAKELLEIYSKREIATRAPYLPDEDMQKHIDATFKYPETPDQAQAIEDIKKDMESEKPMDRIVCGDVGFGKTEVALRAIMKAVVSGKQAVLLCPTTILANQHFQNFKERFKNLPLKISMLSRLDSKKRQKEIIEELKSGKIDIVIGTHRLLSNDVDFKSLGLLVIDDEQRFGVKQKERFKKIRATLDVLSLSATPIPRTLYMALSSLKSISLIQTPPTGRLAVKTFVMPFKKDLIKRAIENELLRNGQVYYLHNRVQTIEMAKKILEELCPKKSARWRIGIAHGRLREKKLIEVMTDFQNRKTDVLVATTIIESGLDLPNVNTLIVADAARLGLSQAYQIRGRIGRSSIQAFSYFLHGKRLQELAEERLKSLKEAEELGSGYRIAMRDLEIRGAGNILGKEQSGNVNSVGLNLYCQILSEAIENLKIAAPAP